ncbi:rhodanese-like domain-containing protein [Hymenobacter sp.]|uniref:rhodanese-like domain-containing protein n=1 Tax=Hymenobacter sp. TaxID=1898978 RepID=UPI002869FAEB|nr:rhodanese-like domain-containing protein [Hymenobacter sp.]
MEAQLAHYQHKLAYEMDSADLYDAVQSGAGLIIIDARKPAAHAAEHIPGAISFSHRLMTEESTRALDKSKLYVTYCDGIGCNASTKGALKLMQLGFQVKELLGGIDWWKRDGYATQGQAAPLPADAEADVTCSC